MNIETSETTIKIDTSSLNEVVILPYGFEENINSTDYMSSAISLHKLLKEKIPTKLYSEPQSLIELRDSSWIGPAILLSLNLINENSDALKLIIESFVNSIKKHTLSESSDKVELDIYCETPKGKIKKVQYKGPKESLGDVEGIIKRIFNEK